MRIYIYLKNNNNVFFLGSGSDLELDLDPLFNETDPKRCNFFLDWGGGIVGVMGSINNPMSPLIHAP